MGIKITDKIIGYEAERGRYCGTIKSKDELTELLNRVKEGERIMLFGTASTSTKHDAIQKHVNWVSAEGYFNMLVKSCEENKNQFHSMMDKLFSGPTGILYSRD